VGVSRDCPNFWVPPVISKTGNATDFKFCGNIYIGSIRTKAHENVRNNSRRRSQGVPKMFRAPMYRAHCAVIFAMAQLSCSYIYCLSPKVDRAPTLCCQDDFARLTSINFLGAVI